VPNTRERAVKIYPNLINMLDETAHYVTTYEGWNFNSGNYLFTTDTK